jgi:predicted nucleic acid-binding protein
MSDRFFVDTNVLVYAHDRAAGTKHDRAVALVEKLWNSGEGVLSTQVLQELCVSLRREVKRPLSGEETVELIEDYLSWEIAVNTGESVMEALALERQFNISFWDALILQAARASGAVTLYSEDLTDGRAYGTVRVLNPLIRDTSG